MKNKKVLIIVGSVILVLAIAAGIFFAYSSKKASPSAQAGSDEELAVPSLAPDAIGLSLTPVRDGKAIMMKVMKIDGIAGIDYEVTYTAKGDIPRGVIGHIDVKPSDSSVQQEVVLGTCSNVCHYDEDVTGIKFVLKVAKTDNKIYQITQTTSL